MTTKRLARHNAVAVYPDLASATAALDELWEDDFSKDEVSLLAKEAVMRPGTGDITETRTQSSGGAGKGAVAGIAAGGATGATLGAIAGLAAAVIPGVGIAVGTAVGLGALSGAAAGHITGGLLGAEAAGRKAMMWEQTLQPLIARVEQGDVLLGVHSDDGERVDRAEKLLGSTSAAQVHRLEADETFSPPGNASALIGTSIPSGAPDAPGADVGRHETSDDENAEDVSTESRGSDQPD